MTKGRWAKKDPCHHHADNRWLTQAQCETSKEMCDTENKTILCDKVEDKLG
jgi:hypothetical protein